MKKLYAMAFVLTILGLARCGYRFAETPLLRYDSGPGIIRISMKNGFRPYFRPIDAAKPFRADMTRDFLARVLAKRGFVFLYFSFANNFIRLRSLIPPCMNWNLAPLSRCARSMICPRWYPVCSTK